MGFGIVKANEDPSVYKKSFADMPHTLMGGIKLPISVHQFDDKSHPFLLANSEIIHRMTSEHKHAKHINKDEAW